ncbi:MAG TPA: tetratricopeptide repeat protein [Methyloceanibacter sp.]|nr:tetratricopeptide repeat protein [Methyloceanibacter sp.]
MSLSMPLPTRAASPPCEGAAVDSSLPKSTRVEQLTNQALACLKANKSIQAIASLSEVIGADPNRAQAYLNRGNLFVRMGQFNAGLTDYNRVIALEPGHFEAWYNRGSARVVAGEYDAAIADLTEAIKLKPDLARAYCNRGLGLLRKGDQDKARDDFEKGLEIKIDLPLCYYGRGEVKLSEGRYQEAIDDLTIGINLKPAAEALAHRATAYERLGENSQALRDYRNALSMRPRLETAEAGIARLTQGTED